jgi:hypothetical protein
MQDYAVHIREHVKNTRTKPVQSALWSKECERLLKQKNPGSAATETGIKSIVKASSFLRDLTRKSGAKSTDNPGGRTLPGGAV